jgi:hypothetical protein
MTYVLKESYSVSMHPVSTTYECGCYYNEVTGDIETCDDPEHDGYVPSYETYINLQEKEHDRRLKEFEAHLGGPFAGKEMNDESDLPF